MTWEYSYRLVSYVSVLVFCSAEIIIYCEHQGVAWLSIYLRWLFSLVVRISLGTQSPWFEEAPRYGSWWRHWAVHKSNGWRESFRRRLIWFWGRGYSEGIRACRSTIWKTNVWRIGWGYDDRAQTQECEARWAAGVLTVDPSRHSRRGKSNWLQKLCTAWWHFLSFDMFWMVSGCVLFPVLITIIIHLHMNAKAFHAVVLPYLSWRLLIWMQEEGASVLIDAYEYITRLQKSVDDLNTELVPLCNPANMSAACLREESLEVTSTVQSTNSGSVCVLYQHPMVGLHLHCHSRFLALEYAYISSLRITCSARINDYCHQLHLVKLAI